MEKSPLSKLKRFVIELVALISLIAASSVLVLSEIAKVIEAFNKLF